MKFILIVGPQAVGKMTVGMKLAEITNLTLFHNHMTSELTASVFGWGRPERRKLSDAFRMQIFEAFAQTDMEGLIFTLVWAFNRPEDKKYVDEIVSIFKKVDADIYIIELETPLEVRLSRNKTDVRLKHKPSKRNIEFSEKDLLETAKTERLNSYPGEITEKNYLRINNTNLSPEETAQKIKKKFQL